MKEWKSVSLFISSTFLDMQPERDYLVKYVFPELSAWCNAHMIRFYDIDLRWGIDERDSLVNKKTVEICLSSIDKCHPFFIGFLGQRRGWVPKSDEISNDTFKLYPLLTEFIDKKMSVTELEITHAVLQPLDGSISENNADKQMVFLKKSNSQKTDDNPESNEFFADSLKKAFDSVYSYQVSDEIPDSEDKGHFQFMVGDISLKEFIISKMKQAILSDTDLAENFSETEEMNQEEIRQKEILFSNCENYLKSEKEFKFLKEFIDNNNSHFLVIYSKGGEGKTSFLSEFITENLQNYHFIYRFLGKTPESTTLLDTINSFVFERDPKRNNYYSILYRWIHDIVFTGLKNLIQSNNTAKTILVFDGIDTFRSDNFCFEDSFSQFELLISELSEGIGKNLKVIMTYSYGSDYSDFALFRQNHSNLDFYEFSPLPIDIRKEIIEDYFGKYLKTISDEQKEIIANCKYSGNPFFLKIMLLQIRCFGDFENLNSFINQVSTSEEMLVKTFLQISINFISRNIGIEPTIVETAIETSLCLIAESYCGLSVNEISDLASNLSDGVFSDKQFADILYFSLKLFNSILVYYQGKYLFGNNTVKQLTVNLCEKGKSLSYIDALLQYRISLIGSFHSPETSAENTKLYVREILYYLSILPEKYDRLIKDFTFVNLICRTLGSAYALSDTKNIQSINPYQRYILPFSLEIDKYPDQFPFLVLGAPYLSSKSYQDALMLARKSPVFLIPKGKWGIEGFSVETYYTFPFKKILANLHFIFLLGKNGMMVIEKSTGKQKKYFGMNLKPGQYFLSGKNTVSHFDPENNEIIFDILHPHKIPKEIVLNRKKYPTDNILFRPILVKQQNDFLYLLFDSEGCRNLGIEAKSAFVKYDSEEECAHVCGLFLRHTMKDFLFSENTLYHIWQSENHALYLSNGKTSLMLVEGETVIGAYKDIIITQSDAGPVNIRYIDGTEKMQITEYFKNIFLVSSYLVYTFLGYLYVISLETWSKATIPLYDEKELREPYAKRTFFVEYSIENDILFAVSPGNRKLVIFDLEKRRIINPSAPFLSGISAPYCVNSGNLYAECTENTCVVLDVNKLPIEDYGGKIARTEILAMGDVCVLKKNDKICFSDYNITHTVHFDTTPYLFATDRNYVAAVTEKGDHLQEISVFLYHPDENNIQLLRSLIIEDYKIKSICILKDEYISFCNSTGSDYLLDLRKNIQYSDIKNRYDSENDIVRKAYEKPNLLSTVEVQRFGNRILLACVSAGLVIFNPVTAKREAQIRYHDEFLFSSMLGQGFIKALNQNMLVVNEKPRSSDKLYFYNFINGEILVQEMDIKKCLMNDCFLYHDKLIVLCNDSEIRIYSIASKNLLYQVVLPVTVKGMYLKDDSLFVISLYHTTELKIAESETALNPVDCIIPPTEK